MLQCAIVRTKVLIMIHKHDMYHTITYWCSIDCKTNNCKGARLNVIEGEDGTLFTKVDDVRDDCHGYLVNLVAPPDDPNFDEDFMHHVERHVKTYGSASTQNKDCVIEKAITYREDDYAIRQSKMGKAGDFNGGTAENLK